MTDVFLSYASEDRARIEPLVAALEADGLSVWWDRLLIGGHEYTDLIQRALNNASCIVAVWSHHSIESNWVRDEAQEGMERKCLVPCSIDDVRPPLGFRSLQTVQLVGWPDQQAELLRLLEAVRARLAHTDIAAVSRDSVSSSTNMSSPRERSIAVLPFKNLSSDQEQQYFCDGLVDDIITELSYIKPLLVISRNSAFTYNSEPQDLSQVARELGVNYILLGSVRRSRDNMRLNARLVYGSTQEMLWSKRFDRAVTDLFDLQDELTNEIVTILDVNIVSGDLARRVRKIDNVETREQLYKGMFEYHKFDHAAWPDARRYFKQVIRDEPGSVEGYVWLLLTYSFGIVVGWDAPGEALPLLKDIVDRALAVDANDGRALMGDGIYKVIVGELDSAHESLQRAIEVEPNLDDAWFHHGWALMFLGDAAAAVASLERAKRLSPMPNAIRYGVLGTAQRNAGRYQAAIKTFEECLRRFPDFVYAHTSLAIVHGLMGNLRAARRELQHTLKADPTYTVQRFVNPNLYRSPSVMEQCADVLRAAGLPES